MGALHTLWTSTGGDPAALAAVTLTGAEPALPSSFAVGTLAQASIAAVALAAAALGRERGGPAQTVQVDLRHAAVEFRSERYLRIDGAAPPDPWDPLAGLYRCADGAVRLHTNFPHHRDAVLRTAGVEADKAALARALAERRAEEVEQAVVDAGGAAAALRTFAQWDAHPQGRAVAAEPLVGFEHLDDAPPAPLPPPAAGRPPLDGVRMLDLTRVIAGPVAARALAAHGADVLRITAAHLPTIASLDPDTGRGKRAAQLDLRTAEGVAALRALVQEADVVVQAYRPGALAARGFGAADLARLKPGLVVGSLAAWGHGGPWGGRRGFDSLVQTAAGFNAAEAEAAGAGVPRALPAQALDHAAGYLLALGVLQALRRRMQEGGGRHVRVSLARTALWLRSLPRTPAWLQAHDPGFDDVRDLLEQSDSHWGRLTAVRHAGRLSHTPPAWRRPAVRLDHGRAVWA